MPAWAISIGKWIGLELLKMAAQALRDYFKKKAEERKTAKEIKSKVKELRNGKSEEDIRRAVRDLNI